MKAINVNHIISIEQFDKELTNLKYFKENDVWVNDNISTALSWNREELSEKYLIDEENNVYTKPEIKITLSNNKTESKYFETEVDCMYYLRELFEYINKGQMFINIED